jgi:Fe-S-cluster-containing dehydrogenase component
MGEKMYPHQVGTTMKCNFCLERIDAGSEKGLKPGIDRDATPACVNTCQARALTFGDLDDPESNVSQLLRGRNGFVLQEEYETEPSVYYVDGKIGGKSSNIAPESARTGSHITHLSSVEKKAREIFGSLPEKQPGKQKEK